jgi:tRNA threonylcarbamoyladenosine biosynthesis protein TsaE
MIIFDLQHIKEAAALCWEQTQGATALAFHGEMGSGKTTFIHALCEIKKVKDKVSSPTFSIINEYIYMGEHGQTEKIFHLDLYRLKDLQEAINAGVEDCLYQPGICLIEWPEIIESILPATTIHLYLKVLDIEKRMIKIG